MESVTVTITNPFGLHSRPTSLLIKIVKEFECEIELFKNGNSGNKQKAKSMISVMALGAVKGDQLTFEAEGKDEKEAIKAIKTFITNGCGE